MFPGSHGFVAMPVTSSVKDECSNIPIKLMKVDEIVLPCDRHSNETVILRKHVTKYKHKRQLIVEFLRKFENRGIKIASIA